jgi:hypothetical protein
MARLSQSLLANLGRPAYQESMFGLGQAIGGLGSQRREQQQKQEVNKLLQQIQGAQGSGDFNSMKILSQQLATIDPQQAAQVMQAATNLEQKLGQQKALGGLLTGEPQTPESFTTAAQQALSAGDLEMALDLAKRGTDLRTSTTQKEAKKNAAVTELQGFMQDPRVSQEDKLQVRGVLQGLVTGQTDVETVGPQLEGFRDRFKPKAVGSRAAPVFKDLMRPNPQTGVEEKRTIRFDRDPVTGDSIETDVGRPVPKEFAPKDTTGRGDIARSAQPMWKEMNEQASTASTALRRNKDLQARIMSSPAKSSGIISDVRTRLLDIAGLRDAEEIQKTEFFRNVNNQIITGLPPGVASDRDIEIFSKGFPTGNASSEEIQQYLAVEQRFLGITQDVALLAEQFLDKQMSQGIDGTLVGFNAYKAGYSVALTALERNIQQEVADGVDPTQAQQKHVNAFRQAFGFTPSYYL